MQVNEVREKFIKFFEEKGHVEIASSSLVPQNDPTTLFTGSGMQQLMPYLLGKKHPKGNRLVDSQKCFRAEDIDEVGNKRHTTFFEMLGNWSLGDYFKKEQLPWVFELLTKEFNIEPNNLYITVFSGSKKDGIVKDEESAYIWEEIFKNNNIEAKIVEIGSCENGGQNGMQGGRIFYYDASKNWWSRAGAPENMPPGEPGGPDSEIFYEFTNIEHDKSYGKHCHPNCDCGRFMEIGNSVFMEYIKNKDGTFSPLPNKNVDFGGGLERITAAINNDPDIFNIDLFQKAVLKIEDKIGTKYGIATEEKQRAIRILCDHIRAATFIIGDGIKPSNLGQGYVLRRLIRRAIRFARIAGIYEQNICSEIASSFVNSYKDCYKNLGFAEKSIITNLSLEETKFANTLESGIRQFEKIAKKRKNITAEEAFNLFATHGFPLEMTKEMAKENGLKVDEAGFIKKFEEHQKVSRADIINKKFTGGLENKEDPMIIKYHTLAHLVLAALREVLGDHVHQKGSNITAERVRFDFSHSDKMTDKEKEEVEKWVNDKLSQGLEVFFTEADPETAKEKGAEGEFSTKYGDKVTVYTVGGKLGSGKEVSAEICGGPHVKNLSEIKGKFKIKKEESSSAGVRRIKAIIV